MRRISVILIALAMLSGFVATGAHAAVLKVLVTNGTRAVIDDLVPKFERATGHKLAIKYDGSPLLQKAIEGGESFDIVLLAADSMDAIGKKIDPATRKIVARSGIGVAVRAGAEKPDIGTADAFKQAMLAAKSIAYVTAGISGRHFIAVCERLGIGDEVKAKGKTKPSGNVAGFVAAGEAELAVQQISELMSAPGVELVGPLPEDLQLTTVFSAAIAGHSSTSEAARAFISFLATPDAIAVIKAKGMEPG